MSAALNILMSMTQDAMVYKVSSSFFFMVSFFVFDCSSARTRANPFYNFMQASLSLRIVEPITPCFVSFY